MESVVCTIVLQSLLGFVPLAALPLGSVQCLQGRIH